MGGEYVTVTGNLIRIDERERALLFSDKRVVFIEDISEIQGKMLSVYD